MFTFDRKTIDVKRSCSDFSLEFLQYMIENYFQSVANQNIATFSPHFSDIYQFEKEDNLSPANLSSEFFSLLYFSNWLIALSKVLAWFSKNFSQAIL